jgi:hypothetical protein
MMLGLPHSTSPPWLRRPRLEPPTLRSRHRAGRLPRRFYAAGSEIGGLYTCQGERVVETLPRHGNPILTLLAESGQFEFEASL